MEFNPIVVSVLTLCVLCLLKINVLFSLMISAIVAGIISGMTIPKIMELFVSGMGQNSETALSYILLGTLAASMTHTGLTEVLSVKISIASKRAFLLAKGSPIPINTILVGFCPVFLTSIIT